MRTIEDFRNDISLRDRVRTSLYILATTKDYDEILSIQLLVLSKEDFPAELQSSYKAIEAAINFAIDLKIKKLSICGTKFDMIPKWDRVHFSPPKKKALIDSLFRINDTFYGN